MYATLRLVAVGLVVLVLFGLFERRTPQPLVNMRTFARRRVLTTNVSTVLIGSAMISTFMLVPLLAQLPAGSETGLRAVFRRGGPAPGPPGGLLSLLVAPIVGRFGERSGSKAPFFAGCLVTAGALLGMALAHDSVGLVILWSSITSVGVGAASAAIPNLIVVAVDENETGEATGFNTVMRNIGSAVGAQVAGSIIATQVLANGLPTNAAFTTAFLVSATGAVIAALSVLVIPGRLSQQSAAESRTQAPVAAKYAARKRSAQSQTAQGRREPQKSKLLLSPTPIQSARRYPLGV